MDSRPCLMTLLSHWGTSMVPQWETIPMGYICPITRRMGIAKVACSTPMGYNRRSKESGAERLPHGATQGHWRSTVQYQSIRPDPKRDADAARLAADGATWPVYTLKRDHGAFEAGTVFYGVPSRSNPKHRWLANGVACELSRLPAARRHVRPPPRRAPPRSPRAAGRVGLVGRPHPRDAVRHALPALRGRLRRHRGSGVGESCLGCGSERAYRERIAAKIAAGVR
jgi:hypothetical protein